MRKDAFLKKNDIDGGKTCPIVNYIKKNGSCNSSAIRAKLKENEEDYFYGYTNWQDQVFQSYPLRNLDPSAEKIVDHQSEIYAKNVCSTLGADGFDLKLLPSLDVIQKILENDDPAAFINALSKSMCSDSNHFQVNVPVCRNRGIGSWNPTVEKNEAFINSHLEQVNAQPIGIDFCSEVFKDGKDYDGNAFQRPHGFGERSQDCGEHAALIIGRRTNPKTKSCEYLVRNSWGWTCDEYADDWQGGCGKGSVWINADSLARNIYGFNYLQ